MEKKSFTSSETEVFSFSTLSPTLKISNNEQKINPEDVMDIACTKKGCESLAVRKAEGEDEFCSNKCAVAHCNDVFTNWVSENLAEQQKN